jgi:hypothetical protein
MRMSNAARLAILLLLFAPLSHAYDNAPLPPTPPDDFTADIGGFDGPNYHVELKSDGVHYDSSGAGNVQEKVVVHPSLEAWATFMQALNTAKLYRWAPTYSSNVMDGVQWKIRLRAGDRVILTQGSNNFPRDGDERHPSNSWPTPSKNFQSFCDAVSQLVGKPFH